jgi:hypothetical protein
MYSVSRATLYNYMKHGRISANPDGMIDASELLRAGFTLRPLDTVHARQNGQTLTPPDPSTSDTHTLTDMIAFLREELSHARRALDTAHADNRTLHDEAKTERIRLLTLLEHEQRNHQLILEAGQPKSFWQRWFQKSPRA